MGDTHRLIISPEALDELYRIADYIRQSSPDAAAAVAETILDAIDSLSQLPARFKRVARSRKRGTPIHAMVVRPFIVYYCVDEPRRVVHILKVIHGAQHQPRRFD
jgi:plasmid stabilization system protein ParE